MDGLVRYASEAGEEDLQAGELQVTRKREARLRIALTALLFVNLVFLSGAVTLLTLLSKQ